jgi:DNA mismatch repair protein MutS
MDTSLIPASPSEACPGPRGGARFYSILYRERGDRPAQETMAAPACFHDLNLDQIVAAITLGREEYDLRPFFYAPLGDGDAVRFRQEVMRDLERSELRAGIKAFAQGMRAVREHLAEAEKLRHQRQKERAFLNAAESYCRAVAQLAEDLSAAEPSSRGLGEFRKHLTGYINTVQFIVLQRATTELAERFHTITYDVLIDGLHVAVRRHQGEADYSAEVLASFARFKQQDGAHYKFDFADPAEVDYVEGRILDLVAQLFAEEFAALGAFQTEYHEFQDATLVEFDREIQFYIAYLEYTDRLRRAGLGFCYPQITPAHDEIFVRQGFDLALAGRLADEDATPVGNDFHLAGPERIIVVSGPNQGGKTTFARMFGQLHWLASLGCPVPGKRAQLHLFDRMFTHFERGENIADRRGKLQDDLVRMRSVLDAASPRSIIIMNEIFASTTLRDAIALSKKIATAIIGLGVYCVWVTFLDELAALGPSTVSMTSTVVPQNPAERTYKILRRPADGLAHAMSIAEKHRLTYRMIRERLGR